ncbi:hypothetical protein [Streptomyces prasinopilosus]|uniref:hypothetical protein n=1 Tax=Streptomyces prasinopilosus TaxID=67344 RepID=UPI0006EB711C|nr:hypothetical protein [Streptomyces prasinopilosus]
MNAETFNRLYPVGTPVFAYPGCRPEDDPKDTRLVTRTRSEASVFGGVAVVMVDGYERINLTHVDVVSEGEWEAARAAETAAPALSAPVGDQPQPLDDQRLAEITARVAATSRGPWTLAYESCGCCEDDCGHGLYVSRLDTGAGPATELRDLPNSEWELMAHAREDVPTLLAEVQRLKAERHTTNEALSEAAEALREMRDRLAELEAATGEDDPNDRRRRIYIDGNGEAWLSLSSDREIRYIGKLAGAFDGDDTTDSVRERTGSLREIGRCW